MKIKNKLSFYGITCLILFFIAFYFIASFFLDRNNLGKEVDKNLPPIVDVDKNYTKEKDIVLNSYNKIRLMYDVVNSQFKLSSDDMITINDIVYKRITNFDEVTNNLLTVKGINKYIADLGNYFAYYNEEYYLASNLTNYQTYYFRGDNTNIYIMDANDEEITAVIYEKWTSNNKSTLASVKLVREDTWLIDDISVLNHE